MVVVSNFAFWVFDIHTKHVLENDQIKIFPVLIKNMGSRDLVLEDQSDKVDKCYFGFLLGYWNHFHQFVDGFERDVG